MLRPLAIRAAGVLAAVALLAAAGPALAAPGDLDTGFDSDGKWTTANIGSTSVLDVDVDDDGRTVVVGNSGSGYPQATAYRLTPSGQLDASFTGDGVHKHNLHVFGSAFTLVNAESGGILVATRANGFENVRRYSDAGVVEWDGPYVAESPWQVKSIQFMERLADGSIIVVGTFSSYYGSPDRRVGIWRLTPTGQLDLSYDGNGVKLLPLGPAEADTAIAADLDSDENVVIAMRRSLSYDSNGNPTQATTALVRVTPTGQVDTSFGPNGDGWLVHPYGEPIPTEMVVTSDDRIVTGRSATVSGYLDWQLRGYTRDGYTDLGFGGLGTSTFSITDTDRLYDLVALPNGGVVAGGSTAPGAGYPAAFAVAAVLPNGQLDLEFSQDGRALGWQGTANEVYTARALSVTADHVVAAGEGPAKFAAARWQSIDAWDSIAPRYGENGTVYGRVGVTFDNDEDAEPAEPTGARPGEDIDYSISPALPPDLTFNEETGAIESGEDGPLDDAANHSGHPVNTKTTTHTVTATSSYGRTAEATVKLVIRPPDVAQQFRPILRFDSTEKWRPLDVERFFEEGADFPSAAHDLCQDDGESCLPVDDADDLRVLAGADPSQELLDVHGSERDDYKSPRGGCVVEGAAGDVRYDCDVGENSGVYFRHTPADGPLQFFDYWFFYRYNDYPVDGWFDIGQHEADWERVMLAVPDADPTTFTWAGFSGHGTTWRYLRDVLNCDGGESGPAANCGSEAQGSGQRVNVFVAEGSHANYPFACETNCDRPDEAGAPDLVNEQNYDGGDYWGRNDDPDGLKPFPQAERPSLWSASPPASYAATWVDWPGRWGLQKSVASPGNQGQFFEPWDADLCSAHWSAEEYECPDVGFYLQPTSPEVDETVYFASTSTTDGPPARLDWDLDGDRQYDDATGEEVTYSYPSAGARSVGLRVEDARGFHALTRKEFEVFPSGDGLAMQTLASGSEDLRTLQSTPTSGCGPWAGPGVQLVACDPATLEDALAAGNGPAKARLGGLPTGSVSAQLPGLIQSVGPGLRPGASVSLPAAVRGRELRIRASNRKRASVAVFSNRQTEGASRVTVGATSAGYPVLRLVHKNGVRVTPQVLNHEMP